MAGRKKEIIMRKIVVLLIGLILAIPSYSSANRLGDLPIRNHFVKCHEKTPNEAANVRVDDFFDMLEFTVKDDPLEIAVKWDKVNDSLYKVHYYTTNLMSGKKSVETFGFRLNGNSATIVYYDAGKGEATASEVIGICTRMCGGLDFYTSNKFLGFKRRNLPTK